MSYSLCATPSGSSWDHNDVDGYSSTYAGGTSVSIVVYAKEAVDKTDEKVQVLYVVRDEDGKAVSELCSVRTASWNSLWSDRYYYPTLAKTPTKLGSYTFEVYFDGALALKKNFKITE